MPVYPENFTKYYLSDNELKLFVEFVDKYAIPQHEIAEIMGMSDKRLSNIFSSVRQNKLKKENMKRVLVERFLDRFNNNLIRAEYSLLEETRLKEKQLQQKREDYQNLKVSLGFINNL